MTLGTIITILVGLLFLATYKYFYNAPSRALEAHDKRLDGIFGCFSVLRRIDQDQQAEISGRLRGGQTVPQELVLRSPLGDVYPTIHGCFSSTSECYRLIGEESILPWRRSGNVYEALNRACERVDQLSREIELADSQLQTRRMQLDGSQT